MFAHCLQVDKQLQWGKEEMWRVCTVLEGAIDLQRVLWRWRRGSCQVQVYGSTKPKYTIAVRFSSCLGAALKNKMLTDPLISALGASSAAALFHS